MSRRLPWLVLVALVVGTPAYADDTALNDGAYGPEPVGGGITGHESVIRMASEHLDLRMGTKTDSVVARFVFRNTLAGQTARQLVGFPDTAAAGDEAGRRSTKAHSVFAWEDGNAAGPLRGMQTFIDGKPVVSTLRYGYVKNDDSAGGYGWRPGTPKDGALMAWHAVWVDFPAGKDVVIERRYYTAVGSNVLGQHLMDYVVATGGIWHGTIGELVADVTLADGLTVRDLAWGLKLEEGRTTYPPRNEWQVVSPTHLRLHWHDFEPRTSKRYAHLMLASWPRIDAQGKPFKRR